MTPSKPAVQTHVTTSGDLPLLFPTTLTHLPAGCGHGGTRNSSTSRRVQTWSVNPAAIAGVCDRHCLAEPLPFVGSGGGKGRRTLFGGKQKWSCTCSVRLNTTDSPVHCHKNKIT